MRSLCAAAGLQLTTQQQRLGLAIAYKGW